MICNTQKASKAMWTVYQCDSVEIETLDLLETEKRFDQEGMRMAAKRESNWNSSRLNEVELANGQITHTNATDFTGWTGKEQNIQLCLGGYWTSSVPHPQIRGLFKEAETFVKRFVSTSVSCPITKISLLSQMTEIAEKYYEKRLTHLAVMYSRFKEYY